MLFGRAEWQKWAAKRKGGNMRVELDGGPKGRGMGPGQSHSAHVRATYGARELEQGAGASSAAVVAETHTVPTETNSSGEISNPLPGSKGMPASSDAMSLSDDDDPAGFMVYDHESMGYEDDPALDPG
jgi:hypothetical protein